MKVKNIIFISLFLLIILTVGAVSASDDTNSSDVVSVDDNQELVGENLNEDAVQGSGVEIYVDDEDKQETDFEFEVDSGESITIDVSSAIKGNISVKINESVALLNLEEDESGDEYIFLYLSGLGKSKLEVVAEDGDDDPQILLDKLPAGVYNIDVTFTPQGGNPTSKTFKITLVDEFSGGSAEEDKIDLTDFYIYNNENSIITIPQSFLPTLEVVINNKTQTIEDRSGKYCVDLSKFDLGNYDILIFNATDVLFNETFTVGGLIYANSYEFTYKDSVTISLKLPVNATGSLIIYREVNYEEPVLVFNQTLVNGSASYSLATTGAGLYGFSAWYEGEDYGGVVEDFDEDITIYPIITCPSRMTVGEKKYMTFDFGPGAQGEVSIESDVYEYARVSLKNGKASIALANLDDGNFELYVSFNDINGLPDPGTPFEIEVKEVPIRITGSKNINMYYFDGTTHKVTIYGTNGKYAERDEYVEVDIGGISFDCAVGANGVVSFRIPKSIAPGKYKIRTTYEEVTVTSTLIVKHVLKLKKVKISVSAKKVVIKATLKKGKKPLKGKKVTFSFRGKKIIAKTNKKGVAKAIVKKSILSKLKPGKKFKYMAKYFGDKVKRTVKIKK